LIVRGDGDHRFSRAEAVELSALVGGAQLLHVPNAGHIACNDNKEACLLGVQQYLRF
jgi:pimeloyl-ACP methyl ester carboxylesterase